MLQSIVKPLGAVQFPAFTAERVYMREFRKSSGLPADLSHWQPTVDAMLDGVDTDGPIYLMIDQGVVRAGTTQRRPGLHVDGYWVASKQRHGGGGGHCGSWDSNGGWKNCNFSAPEALILASNVTASRALVGQYEGLIGDGGDCSRVDTRGLSEIILQGGIAYAGNVTMLHESLPVATDCQRALVRLSVPGWSPELH